MVDGWLEKNRCARCGGKKDSERIAELEAENEQLRLAYRTLRGMLANAGQSAHAVTESVRLTLDAFPVDPTEYGDK